MERWPEGCQVAEKALWSCYYETGMISLFIQIFFFKILTIVKPATGAPASLSKPSIPISNFTVVGLLKKITMKRVISPLSCLRSHRQRLHHLAATTACRRPSSSLSIPFPSSIFFPSPLSLFVSLVDDEEPQWPSWPFGGYHWHLHCLHLLPFPLLSLPFFPFSLVRSFIFVSIRANLVWYRL